MVDDSYKIQGRWQCAGLTTLSFSDRPCQSVAKIRRSTTTSLHSVALADSAILARIPGDTLDTTAPVSGPPRAFHAIACKAGHASSQAITSCNSAIAPFAPQERRAAGGAAI
jgi:hypothetical protein